MLFSYFLGFLSVHLAGIVKRIKLNYLSGFKFKSEKKGYRSKLKIAFLFVLSIFLLKMTLFSYP